MDFHHFLSTHCRLHQASPSESSKSPIMSADSASNSTASFAILSVMHLVQTREVTLQRIPDDSGHPCSIYAWLERMHLNVDATHASHFVDPHRDLIQPLSACATKRTHHLWLSSQNHFHTLRETHRFGLSLGLVCAKSIPLVVEDFCGFTMSRFDQPETTKISTSKRDECVRYLPAIPTRPMLQLRCKAKSLSSLRHVTILS